MLISMLRNFTKGMDLIQPNATRFATVYLTLTCLHDDKGPLMTMFTSNAWKTTKVASTPEGIRIQNMVLDSRLWKNIVICLKAAAALITVLRLVDSNEKLAMGFIFESMKKGKKPKKQSRLISVVLKRVMNLYGKLLMGGGKANCIGHCMLLCIILILVITMNQISWMMMLTLRLVYIVV
ncbi:hypothetical protein S83_066385 [Arachis hypogaea]